MTIDEFQKVDLRVARVISAERVEGSDKLVRLAVSLGEEERQVLAGIGKAYLPEDLAGKSIVMVANLEPRMMLGLESNGMLLAAENEANLPVVLTTESDVPPGTRVR